MIITSKLIKSLNPCKRRYQNWLKHYKNFKGTDLEFLALEHITPQDKIWVLVRVLPKDLVVVFAWDCAMHAADAADAVYAAATYAAAAYAADAVYAADAAAAERERQLDALAYLIRDRKGEI